ncbi:hypothetical protein B1992_08785 [Pseudoxanthomonas broegbernensis]|uniref:diguanylate cyclase n=1 Tax=Pseudoxanthomonas broegbernensis TaxID=83619 RepID=A0A7V8GM73_9GAMM|nr:diguanylate cyclase [Pseudoxanthomonas broegbernensis]KAF1686308.1 hypothetical protein B1992_08785 [Pseudoxanthomonas broegbernensis]MBB6063994.1 diguanylate cyclase (GGDEF)-like protein [Pseudoxanthomonas broegbernensis]
MRSPGATSSRRAPGPGARGHGGGRWRRLPWALFGLWLALQAHPAFPQAHGLPLMRHFAAGDLPAAPSYSDVVVDAQGTLYAGSKEGVMVLRSGTWELFELPRKAAVFSLLMATDGRLYVGGPGVLGELHREDDGSLRFEDLLARFSGGGQAPPAGEFYGLVETARGVYFRDAATLFLLERGGGAWRHPLPRGLGQRFFAVGDDALYGRIDGIGLCRIEDGVPVAVPGAEAFVRSRITGIWPHADGLLIASDEGFHLGDAHGVRRLSTDADAAFAAHTPYSSLRLADGSLAFGGYDGTLMRFSPDLRLVDRFVPAPGGLDGFAMDREGGLWTVGEAGLTRLRLPSPWTVYDRRHGLENRLFDSAWYDGALWVATLGVLRAEPARQGGAPRFAPQPWTDTELEAFALEGTAAGLLIGDRLGLMVLDPGADRPRRLLGPQRYAGIHTLVRSASGPEQVLALGGREAAWLVLREGRWQVGARWEPLIGEPSGLHWTAPEEVWIGDARGGAHRWRFDPATGELRERRHFGPAQGLAADPELGTHLFRMEGVLYAVSGARVQRLEGERFVAAELPVLPGLRRPWELESADTAIGSFAWTSRQLWRRRATEGEFRLLHVSASRVPGYAALKLQGDGQLRLVARDSLLQFDPGIEDLPPPPLLARLDRIRLHPPDRASSLLPLAPGQVQVLPPGSGLGLRFGLATMEPDVEFRFRMPGYNDAWSGWDDNRELGYRRLPPGDYTFQLQARIRGGREAEPLHYRLRVAPFWYERGWVRALFWIAGLLAVVLAAWLRNRRTNARNRELERKIAERTMELEAANRRLTELAIVDGLTGIANRHAMERALERGWQRCRERGEPLAVVMSDVDRFKEFNDSHGHRAGDEQLRRVARVFDAEVVGIDEVAARYGGEEFVLILPGLALEAAMARAERVRRRVERVTAEAGLPSSISLGVAVTVPVAGIDPAMLMHCADQALYRAKRNGRNRVQAASDEDMSALSGAP